MAHANNFPLPIRLHLPCISRLLGRILDDSAFVRSEEQPSGQVLRGPHALAGPGDAGVSHAQRPRSGEARALGLRPVTGNLGRGRSTFFNLQYLIPQISVRKISSAAYLHGNFSLMSYLFVQYQGQGVQRTISRNIHIAVVAN